LGPIYHSYSKYTDSNGVEQRTGFGRHTTNDSFLRKIAGVVGPVASSIIKGKDNINEIAKCTPDDGDKCMDKCLEESWKETEKIHPNMAGYLVQLAKVCKPIFGQLANVNAVRGNFICPLYQYINLLGLRHFLVSYFQY